MDADVPQCAEVGWLNAAVPGTRDFSYDYVRKFVVRIDERSASP